MRTTGNARPNLVSETTAMETGQQQKGAVPQANCGNAAAAERALDALADAGAADARFAQCLLDGDKKEETTKAS